jgi:hypothetical protein
MATYLGTRIIAGALDYTFVVTRRPDLKTDVDAYLIAQGREDIIV